MFSHAMGMRFDSVESSFVGEIDKQFQFFCAWHLAKDIHLLD
jgi:hypothetical protein